MANEQDDTPQVRTPQDTGGWHEEADRSGSGFYEIRVMGHLDSRWSDWLGALQVETLEDGEMVLTGHLEDQSALMGILDKLHRLNLRLLSFKPLPRTEE